MTNNLRRKLKLSQRDIISRWKKVNTEATTRVLYEKIGLVRNFAKFTGKHLFQSLFFNKVAGLKAAT